MCVTQKGVCHAFLNEDINNISLKRDTTFLLASQEWQRSKSKAVPIRSFNTLGQNKLECKHLLFTFLFMLPFTIKGDYLLDLHLCDLIYNMFGTQSKNYTRYEVDTNQTLQLVYHIDQGQLVHVQLLSDNSVKLIKQE